MKSLHKTFDILEYVVLQNGANVTPTRAAEALSINSVTCTRIMAELVNRGYLTRVSRKDGYIPGPMIPSLVTRQNCYEQLAAAARQPIEELSVLLGCQVNLAVLHAERRIMLCYHLSRQGSKPWDRFTFSDHWETATGRLLIAMQEDREARKLTRAAGIVPFPRKELEQIRRNGWVRFRQDGLVIIGHAVQVPGFPEAAFGFGVAPEHAEKAFAASKKTAENITAILTRPNQAF